MRRGTEKIGVLLLSFAAFAAGVWALYHEAAPWRPWVLRGSFAALVLLALWQTFRRRERKK